MIAKHLLRWYRQQESKDFPWHSSDPYKVWVSEIMLQQTQVSTILARYPLFIRAFPRVEYLAAASLDEVMSLWAGLGYYARAHNLHKTARIVIAEYRGVMPNNLKALMELPGIGRSTAGAILSLAHNMRYPILDTNVKRVLIRYFAITTRNHLDSQLWNKAEECLPHREVGLYNQALMNLGASTCRALSPLCPQCPLSKHCQARALGLTQRLPHKPAKMPKPQKTSYFAFVMDNRNAILLERRPPSGIWSSLWCPPQFDNINQLNTKIRQQFGDQIHPTQQLPTLRHSFSHFNLLIHPILLRLQKETSEIHEDTQIWYSIEHSDRQQVGMPAPIKRLLKNIIS